MPAPAPAASPPPVPSALPCRRIAGLRVEPPSLVCSLDNGAELRVPAFLAAFLSVGDEIACAPDSPSPSSFLVTRREQPREFLFGTIRQVSPPVAAKRRGYFLHAGLAEPVGGITSVVLLSEAVRDYFYRSKDGKTLYHVLGIPATASPAELRLAFRLASLELGADASVPTVRRDLERAFNLLAQPDLRACHDSLALDPEQPARFPYGGCGRILAAGERSPDGRAFFARRILSFHPEHRERQFRAPLRRLEFYDRYAVYRDSRRKVEILLDPVILPLAWDASWNQWKHWAGVKLGMRGTFVPFGKRRFRQGEWQMIPWEAALPSRLRVTLPGDAAERIENACRTHHRFGQYQDALAPLRDRLAREPVERSEIEAILARLGVPGDFDPAMLTWRPDYEDFYFRELRKGARRLYLFGSEYLFEWERAMIAEIPEAGHATYVFARPQNVEAWVRAYAHATREAIRRNQAHAAERLGFLGRVLHGRNPRTWLLELRAKAGAGSL